MLITPAPHHFGAIYLGKVRKFPGGPGFADPRGSRQHHHPASSNYGVF